MSRLHDWFLYTDRNDASYFPIGRDFITTDSFNHKSFNDANSPNWRSEEWFIQSGLVPIDQLSKSVKTLSDLDLRFNPGWSDQESFNFGEHINVDGIDVYAWKFTREDPINRDLIVELRSDFIFYHELINRNEHQYFHPMDDLLVAEISLDSHEFYPPTPRVVVHRDYLRDYLAARKMGLIVSIVADRFANALTKDGLEIDQLLDEVEKDDGVYLSTSINPPHHGLKYYRGRSILRRNLYVEPYEKPKIERSPWPYYGRRTDESPSLFVFDAEGYKGSLADPKCPWYLYFRPEVLQKYLQTPGFILNFHMRNWGIASVPGGSPGIDVGINSQNLINAFAPDLRKLSSSEQAYWASFSCAPIGEICEEMFQTRMQQRPPHSPGTVELVKTARSRLNQIFKAKFLFDLYDDSELESQPLSHLSVGAVTKNFSELLGLAKLLYKLFIEDMKISALRMALGDEIEYGADWRQIKLLEELIKLIGSDDDAGVRKLTDPLRGLNKLRVADAHILNANLDRAFSLLGSNKVPETPRYAWIFCVDSIVKCINEISDIIEFCSSN